MTQAPFELPTVRFGRDTTGFAKTLRQRVDAYFKENGIHKKATTGMKFKTVILLSAYFAPLALISAAARGGKREEGEHLLRGLRLAGAGFAGDDN